MTHIAQLVAIEQGVKNTTNAEYIQLSKDIGKDTLTGGLIKTYRPVAEDGDLYPQDRKDVQLTVAGTLPRVAEILTRLFDVTRTKDEANTKARADVVVDDVVVLRAVPVTYILFLEKQCIRLREFIHDLPTLDPAQRWHLDNASNVWATEPIETHKTKKVPKVIELAKATDKHPAQVHLLQEDIVEGYWTTVKFSGALPAAVKQEYIERIEKLINAVKFAREQANLTVVDDASAGSQVFGYLFGPQTPATGG